MKGYTARARGEEFSVKGGVSMQVNVYTQTQLNHVLMRLLPVLL